MNQQLTGYPSIDKPWMRYYQNVNTKNAIQNKSMYELLVDSNKDRQDSMS